jgi:hypothetical protein
MIEYHKIQTAYLRDPDTNFKSLLEGQWSKLEFGYLANNDWEWTEKVDGMNIRVMWDGSTVKFAGKSDNAQIHPDLFRVLIETFTAQKMGAQFGVFDPESVTPIEACLYGEGYGAGIQKGGNYRPDKSFILFDVKVGDTWLERNNVADVANGLGCDMVPVVGIGTLSDAVEFAKSGYDSICAQTSSSAEGLIMRPLAELRNRRGERVITKIKYKDFSRAATTSK